jgi:hypothetical protein
MTYGQLSYDYDNFRPNIPPKGGHRKTQSSSSSTHLSGTHSYYNSPSSTVSHGSFSNPRTLPPYISLQRASEPGSPATIATTISSPHSTPSPSPANMPNTASNTDFTLFDDTIMAVAAQNHLNGNSNKGRAALAVSSSMAENNSALNSYAPTGFPIIVHHDVPYSSYAQSGLYGNYPSGGYSSPTSSNFYGLSQDQQQQQQQVSQSQQRQQPTSGKYLRPSSYSNLGNGNRQRPSASDVEPIENVPALSPTTKSRNDPRSPHLQAEANSQTSGYGSSSYMQSATPKLGRTYSDVMQDELYNPEPALTAPQERAAVYQKPEIKSENQNSFPRIFHEAQQQHQQHFSHSASGNRDRSPFRHDSPFHPTNTSQVIDQNQLAMALALREQMRKEAEQTVAPKTISPRDSLLEYQEPENQHGQMALFPPLQDARVPATHDDAMSNGGSLHASSHDGSDLDDFQSMATSRRASMDVPRFGYMQQPSFDAMSTNPYYYTDSSSLGAPMQLSDPSAPYIKEEMGNPIPRPLDTSANTGTYTCTYSGCGQRFTTSTKLQKHRREAHRKSAPSGNSVSSAAAIASRNAQPGPHRCMRVNPSTGKPCNTVFSRPYDLTRHEDTIHNIAKAKARCEICDDDKFFSRSDALVRHRRVKHGIH